MKKPAFIYLIWTVFLICGCLSSDECRESSEEESNKCGYIFTSPRSLKTGATNQLNLRRFGNCVSCKLSIKVMYQDSYTSNESLATEKTFNIEEGNCNAFMSLRLKKFDTYVYNGKIIMNGTCGECKFGGKDNVYFHQSKDNILLVQTDKSLYKDNQNVKFRVLLLDKHLKPEAETVKGNIRIENPSGIRFAQWTNVSLGNMAMEQYEFPLTDVGTPGTWTITAIFNDETTTRVFEVREYVLPKFEVTIKLPSYVLINAKKIPITVCANYTYGKPVRGDLRMNISLETYSWSNEKLPTIEYEGKINGCFDYVINVSRIQSGGDYYSYRRPQIVCEVKEADTGVTRNATEYIQRHSSPFSLNFYRDTKLKPGLPYIGKLFAKNPDNSPACDEPIQICYTSTRERVVMNGEWKATRTVKNCKNFTTNGNGEIIFSIPPSTADIMGMNAEAKSLKYVPKKTKTGAQPQNSLSQPQTSMSLTPWFSPSGSFLQIQQVDGPLLCGTKANIKLLFTSKEDVQFKLHYQLISQGEVIKVGSVEKCFSTDEDVSEMYKDPNLVVNTTEVQIVPSIEPSIDSSDSSTSKDDNCHSVKEARYVPFVGEVSIDVPIEAGSSNIYFLAYYIRPNGEVVADSQKFSVEKCFKNQVKFQFGDDVKQPGTKTSIKVSASPNSLCGIKVVDKSVSLLKSDDQLTTDKVFGILDSLDMGMYYGINHCNEDVPQPGLYTSSSRVSPTPSWSSSSMDDSMAAFENSGKLIISNLIVFSRPCKSRGDNGNIVYEDSSFSAFGGAVHSKVAMASTARRPAAPQSVRGPVAAEKLGDVAATKSVVEVRSEFPETWLFELEMLGPEAVFQKKEKLPHTITEWVGSAVCINKEDGLGISNTTTIKGFQAFFMDVTLPYSITRGENCTIAVSLFNYLDKPFAVLVSLDWSEGLEVDGEKSKVDDNCTCLQNGTSTNLKYLLSGLELGPQNITVRAETTSSCVCGSDSASDVVAKDAIKKSVIIEAEGYPAEAIKTVLVCGKGEDDVVHRRFIYRNPTDLVNGSLRAYFDVTGNVMGKSLRNIDNLVVLPTGCGEQNMVKFDPLVSAVDVLPKDDANNMNLIEKIKRFMVQGYLRELLYKHSDGSFSAFGPQDSNGSMILTAFVLSSFSRASDIIEIDSNIISGCQDWIVSKQQPDGCFPVIGRTFDLKFQDSQEKNPSALTTAYVTKALLTSRYENKTVIKNAMKCLSEVEITSLFGKFMYAGLLAATGKEEAAKELLQPLKEKSVISKKGGECFNDINGTKSQEVMITAYAIIASLDIEKSPSIVLPYVECIIGAMNPQGGFYSTQDTSTALEALAKYAKETSKDKVNMNITVTNGLDANFEINGANQMLVQRRKVETVPSDLKVQAEGSGCVVIQQTVQYNTYTPPQNRHFNIEVKGNCSDEKCNNAKIYTSVSSKDKKTGMSIVKYSLPSGYSPDKESLNELVGKLSIKRCDVEDNTVVIYFDEITKKIQAFSFTVTKVFDVESTVLSQVNVYDYYNTDVKSTATYSLEKCENSTGCNEEP